MTSQETFGDFFREVPKIRRTKIVCTMGPAVSGKEKVKELILCGMDVARLNFSHGNHKQKDEIINDVRAAAKEAGKTVAILQDLQGPKLRVGEMRGGKPILLEDHATLIICSEPVFGTAERVYVDYPKLAEEVEVGSPILLADGSITLKVLAADKNSGEIKCEVIHGGELYPRKGVNLPGVKLSISSLTKKDREDLAYGVAAGVDWIALSFVRSAEDIKELRALVDEIYSSLEKPVNSKKPKLLAKIEKPEAVGCISEIVAASDGIMVARGDLGVEMPLSLVPIAQKAIIAEAIKAGKPVITATQMLESMINAPIATRAEACDVANAVFDGSDAVMLSAETAMGQYPKEAVSFMARVLAETEASPIYKDYLFPLNDIEDEMAQAACSLSDWEKTGALVVYTETGETARHCSACRPRTPIFALCADEDVARQLVLCRGVIPRVAESGPQEVMVRISREVLKNSVIVEENARFVLLARIGVTPFVALCDLKEKK
ncbi:pyruvate kinase [bacterium]|nr:pyruvate kinase [bacterium]